ncbi:MAG: hypothetical protein M3Q62_01815 [Actinomycetota bacterium]|nr:hypothetical protein [Actinomycetota bacterium]MDQ3497505.1 hypothetical protein [Actinomycetota bacterium]
MGSELEKSLTHDVLLDLAGERYFERGEGYHRDGHVYSLVEHDRVIVAKVVGTEEYRVRLWTEDGLAYSCDCPLGVDGAFCKHCVAVGLAWLEGDFSEDTPGGAATMDDVRVYLDGREKDELVGIVMEQAMEDERLRERLLLRSARTGGGTPDAAAFRQAIDRVVEPPGDYWGHGSPWNYARKLESMVESLAELLKEGFAAETIELSEYALAEVEEKAMDYDADGSVHGVLEALEDVHYAACLEARPDPEALARRLFEWEMGGHHDTLFDAANTYADVLGEEGLAEYRRLAGEEWARLPTLGPERGVSWNYDRRRTRLTGMMRALAGDIEELVAVESRDLSHPQAYLRVVGIYHEAGDADKALEWAEEGMWVFPDQKSSGLRDFVIEGYHERSRHAEAMTLAWERYAERPRLEEYQRLKSHADRAGGWKTWREKALASVREDIARRNEEAGSSYFARPVDHSTLVEVLLWEGEVEAAWREAKEGGCSEGLWIELANRRARDHQEDSLSIYEARIEPLVEQTNNAAYEQAYELLLKTRALMQGLGREQEFEEYVKLLREEYKRKRNFMKLLSGME